MDVECFASKQIPSFRFYKDPDVYERQIAFHVNPDKVPGFILTALFKHIIGENFTHVNGENLKTSRNFAENNASKRGINKEQEKGNTECRTDPEQDINILYNPAKIQKKNKEKNHFANEYPFYGKYRKKTGFLQKKLRKNIDVRYICSIILVYMI